MVTKFKNQLAKSNLAKNTVSSYVWTVQYFLNHYGEVNKKNLLAYKGVFGGELQTADSEPALTRNQQVPRVYKTGETKSEVRKSTAKELFGKCNQRCRLQISQSPT